MAFSIRLNRVQYKTEVILVAKQIENKGNHRLFVLINQHKLAISLNNHIKYRNQAVFFAQRVGSL